MNDDSKQDDVSKSRPDNDVVLKLIAPIMMRAIRKALGLSQERMADLVGVSRQMVNYYELAYSYPSPETWVKWVAVVEKQIKQLRLRGNDGGKHPRANRRNPAASVARIYVRKEMEPEQKSKNRWGRNAEKEA